MILHSSFERGATYQSRFSKTNVRELTLLYTGRAFKRFLLHNQVRKELHSAFKALQACSVFIKFFAGGLAYNKSEDTQEMLSAYDAGQTAAGKACFPEGKQTTRLHFCLLLRHSATLWGKNHPKVHMENR